MVKQVRQAIRFLQSHADNWWYGPALALMACVDLFVVVIPTDALLVSAVMLRPRRWLYFAILVSLGSALGVFILAAVLRSHGWPLLLYLSPQLPDTRAWQWTAELMANWGDWTVFLVALSPLPQHPAVALAAFTGIPLWKVALMSLVGRGVKYVLWAWLGTHAPGLLKRFVPLEHDLGKLDLETGKFRNGNGNHEPPPASG